MKKFHYLITTIFICLGSFAQPNLFQKSDDQIPLITNSISGQISISLNVDYFNSIKSVNPCDFSIDLPFFNN